MCRLCIQRDRRRLDDHAVVGSRQTPSTVPCYLSVVPSLPDIIRAARIERGITMRELAARCGLADSTLATIAYGGRANRASLEKLAAYLNIPVQQLETARAAGSRDE